MSNSITNIDQIQVSQASKEVTVNGLFDAASPSMLFGRRASTTMGLTWGYYGGAFNVTGVPTLVSNGTVALTASATNYVEANSAGLVSMNTVGFTSGRVRLYQIVVGASAVTSYSDLRITSNLGGDASPITPIGFACSTETYALTKTISCASASNFDITLTGNITLGFSSAAYDGQKITVRIKQDATGFRTVAFNSTVRFGTDITAFTATTGINKTDILGFIYNAAADKFELVAIVRGY